MEIKGKNRAYQGKFLDAGHPTWNQSNLKTMEDCPFLLWKLKGEGVRVLPGVAATTGISYHAGVELGLRAVLDSGQDAKLSDKIDAATTEFEARKNDTYWDESDDAAKEKDQLVCCVTVHHNVVAPTLKPAHIEIEHTIPGPDYDLAGTLDLIETDGTIVDHKTSARKYQDDAIQGSAQAGMYSLLYRDRFQKESPGFRFDVLIKTKTPTVQKVEGTVSEYDLILLRQRIAVANSEWNHGLHSGLWRLAPEGSWRCSQKWCGLAREGICPKFGGKKHG